jgi:hypothetical protein
VCCAFAPILWAQTIRKSTTAAPAQGDHTGTSRPRTATGTSPSRAVGGGNATTPAAPSDLIATPISDCEIGLTWQRNDTAPAATSYLLERSDDGGATWHPQQTFGPGANLWTDVSGFAEKTYQYRISAIGARGTSSPSTVATARTLGRITGTFKDPTDITVSTPTATTALIGYTNPNTPNDTSHLTYVLERSDDGGYNYRPVNTTTLRDNGGRSQTTDGPIPDSLLTPGKTYYWRLRGLTIGNPTNYVGPISATMPARTTGHPIEPTGTAVVNNSGASNTITWTDHSGGAASFNIERATWKFGDYEFARIGSAPAGATSYTDTSVTPLQSYVYRVCAHNAAGDSDFDQLACVTTASPGSGAGTTYTIGPGQNYTDPGAFPWGHLKPGDTVNIVGNGSAYNEALLISCRGTAAKPITINGVAGSDGKLPVFDGANATVNPQFVINTNAFGTMGGIMFYSNGRGPTTYRPGYITLKNFEIRNFYKGDTGGNTYTDYTGAVRKYPNDSIGIYVLSGDHLTFQNCYVHGNGEGIFAAGQDGFNRRVTDITLRGNDITGNGNVGGYLDHNSYIECIHPLYEYNHYGPPRPGSNGGALKDRSIGTVIRYNTIYNGTQILHLVESQNEASTSICHPDYRTTYVYGNEIHLESNGCSNMMYLGGDNGDVGWYRKGIIYVYHNTFVCTLKGAGHVELFNMQTNAQSVDARNNIIAYFTYGGPTSMGEHLVYGAGQLYCGVNWINSGYGKGNSAPTGEIAGTNNLITGKAPGFTNIASPATLDLHLAPGSPCIDAGGLLPAALAGYPVNAQLLAGAAWPKLAGVPRTTVGAGPDLGPYERGN